MDIEYELTREEELDSWRGNASASGDDEHDREVEQWIEDQIDRGNDWAWCCAKVTARITLNGHDFEGVDYLGQCSYASEADFRADAYFEDMCEQAREDLLATLRAAVRTGELAASILSNLTQEQ